MHPSDKCTLNIQLQNPKETLSISNLAAAKASSTPETPLNEKLDSMSLTPPLTPLRPDITSTTTSSGLENLERDTHGIAGMTISDATMGRGTSVTPTTEEMLPWEKIVPRTYTKRYQLQDSAGSRELGRGAWSTVFRATECLPCQTSAIPTPPTSPASSPSKPANSRLLAVKAAARRDARNILYQEARILTYLHSSIHASRYLVPFHGYDGSQNLVMDAVPLNLDTYAKSCLQTARLNLSGRTMFDPVCGSREWQSLASQLIDGLAFLHGRSCIHGDIKPANILLRPNSDDLSEAHTALYCDFSSSRILCGHNGNDEDQPQQLSALTPDFTSPELFTSLRSAGAVATMAADVYALGVTLLVAAIGTSPYTGIEMLKRAMRCEGRALDFARQDGGTRIMKGKTVDRCLKGALEKSVENRSTVEQWKRDVDAVLDDSMGPNKI